MKTTLVIALLVLFGSLVSCDNPAAATSANTEYKRYLYMTEWTNGKVYYYNPATHAVSSTSLVTTAPNAGEIKFYKGIGYVAIGSGAGGVYYFNPADPSPIAKLLPGTSGLNAQYFAFAGPTKGYVSTVASMDTNGIVDQGGIYAFNPSSLSSGVTQVTGLPNTYWQDILIGSDGMLYATKNQHQAVVRIDTSNNATTDFTTSQSGPTGLTAGTYNGNAGVLVANTGGSIDFIANYPSTTSAVPVTSYSTSTFYPARLVQLTNGNLIAVGSDSSYHGHTFLVALSGTNAASTEIKTSNSGSFGGTFSIAYDSTNDLAYVPTNVYNTSNFLYVFGSDRTQTTFSPVSLSPSAGNLANVAFYQD